MKKLFCYLFFILIWSSCTSDPSSSTSNVNGGFEQIMSSSFVDEKSSSSIKDDTLISYGVIPIDTMHASEYSIDGNVTSSSKTEYHFFSKRTVLYEDPKSNRYTNAYYEELGVQHKSSDKNGGYLVTYRTLSDGLNKYATWLWCNSYLHKNGKCESDYEIFRKECLARKGEFVNYREEDVCSTRQLWLSCVYPLETEQDDIALIDSIAGKIHSFAEEHWSASFIEVEPASTMSASSVNLK